MTRPGLKRRLRDWRSWNPQYPIGTREASQSAGNGFPCHQTDWARSHSDDQIPRTIDRFPAEPGFLKPHSKLKMACISAPPRVACRGHQAADFQGRRDFPSQSECRFCLGWFLLGKPPATEVTSEPWRNLFMQEGLKWHLEQPTAPETKCPPNWQTIVNDGS